MLSEILICPQCGEPWFIDEEERDEPYIPCQNCGKMMFAQAAQPVDEIAKTIDFDVYLTERLEQMDKEYHATDDPIVKGKLKVELALRNAYLKGQIEGMALMTPDDLIAVLNKKDSEN